MLRAILLLLAAALTLPSISWAVGPTNLGAAGVARNSGTPGTNVCFDATNDGSDDFCVTETSAYSKNQEDAGPGNVLTVRPNDNPSAAGTFGCAAMAAGHYGVTDKAKSATDRFFVECLGTTEIKRVDRHIETIRLRANDGTVPVNDEVMPTMLAPATGMNTLSNLGTYAAGIHFYNGVVVRRLSCGHYGSIGWDQAGDTATLQLKSIGTWSVTPASWSNVSGASITFANPSFPAANVLTAITPGTEITGEGWLALFVGGVTDTGTAMTQYWLCDLEIEK